MAWNKLIHVSLLCITGILFQPGAALAQAPSIYADKGGCPGECCSYRVWKTLKPLPVYQNPLSKVKIGELPADQEFEAITGIVYSSPTRLKVIRNHGKFKKGERLYAYTSLGEGFSKVYYQGKFMETDLNETNAYQSMGDYCKVPGVKCWAKRIGAVGKEKAWWVKIKYKKGSAWILYLDEHIRGNDACG